MIRNEYCKDRKYPYYTDMSSIYAISTAAAVMMCLSRYALQGSHTWSPALKKETRLSELSKFFKTLDPKYLTIMGNVDRSDILLQLLRSYMSQR